MREIIAAWLEAKQFETQAVSRRRDLEDQLTELLRLDPQAEGSSTHKPNGFVIKTTQRLNRKIDADKLQELATEAGLDDYLGQLFRWKPELNAKEWRAASEAITAPLMPAITTTPGRPSYSITINEDN
jgi:hypothetical protein